MATQPLAPRPLGFAPSLFLVCFGGRRTRIAETLERLMRTGGCGPRVQPTTEGL
jgi:hypothetical protein